VTAVRPLASATLGGVAFGTAFSVSPAGAASVAALAALVWWIARDLHGVERRWVIGWLTVAVAARIPVVAALPLAVDTSRESFATVFGGDASYMIQRSIWIRNAFVHDPFAPRDFFEAFEPVYGRSAYNHALALLHVFFGPSPYAAHLMSTVLFFAAAVLLFGYVRSSYGRVPAFLGLAILTSMPSLFVWSVAPLKEAPYFLLAAITIAAASSLPTMRRWWHVPLAALAIGAAFLSIQAVRPEAGPLTAAALAAGVGGWVVLRARRSAIVAALVVLALAIGVAGSSRASALVAGTVQYASQRHMGNVGTAGHSFGLLDADVYGSGGASSLDAGAMTRFLVRASVRFFTVPEPWILKPNVELLMIPQQMVWYALVGLAVVGAIAGFRRDPLLTALLSGFVIVSAAAIGATSGNIGTFIRHRDTVVPCVIWLSAIGSAHALAASRTSRFNPLDNGIAIIVLILIPVGFGLSLLFRVPAPRIDAVEPAIVASPGEIVLRGEHLRPFLRAYVSSRGSPIRLLDRMRDAFPPEAPYYARNGREALLKLPALPPATYDLGLFDGGDEVAYVPHAFTVGTMSSDPLAVVVVAGRFTGVDETRARVLVSGAAIKANDGAPLLEILRVGADRPQLASSGPGATVTWVRIEGRSERPATIRLWCQYANNICSFAGRRVVVGQDLSLPFPDFTVTFAMDVVLPDDPRWPLNGGQTKDAVVDFIGWPGAQTHVVTGARDVGRPFEPPVRPAEIVRIVAVEPFVGDASLDGILTGERLFMQQPMVRILAIVRYPLLPSGEVEQRGRPVSLGSRVDFETAESLLRGTITSFVDSPKATQP
jgi:hypothetical protein